MKQHVRIQLAVTSVRANQGGKHSTVMKVGFVFCFPLSVFDVEVEKMAQPKLVWLLPHLACLHFSLLRPVDKIIKPGF
jgi:hypothetical protein